MTILAKAHTLAVMSVIIISDEGALVTLICGSVMVNLGWLILIRGCLK